MRLRTAFLILTSASWVFAQACGGDSGTDLDGGNDGTTPDVGQPQPDSSTQDVVTTPDTGADVDLGDSTTTDASDGGTTKDSGNITTWKCGSVTVSDCSQCTGFTQPCAYCSTADASVQTGACVQTGTNCFNNIPNGFEDCQCNPGDASTCIESYQVCTQNGRCHTCTDSFQNNTLSCQGGGTCAADSGCK